MLRNCPRQDNFIRWQYNIKILSWQIKKSLNKDSRAENFFLIVLISLLLLLLAFFLKKDIVLIILIQDF